jgi:maltose/moltooligosaccharide transporter
MPGKDFLFLSMAGVGIAWSSILSMPYALLANCIPAAKTGFYMGVFNFFIVLPQIAISLGLGEALRFFPAVDSAMVIMGGGFCFLLAAGLTLRVKPTAHAS